MIVFEKSAGAVVFRKEGKEIKYLLLHYPGGHWDFPKGHIEKGESEREALLRETEEETGIRDIRLVPGFRSQIRYFYRAKDEERKKRKRAGRGINIFKKVVYFLGETRTTEIRLSSEHRGYKWLGLEEALRKNSYANFRRIILEADDFLLRHCQTERPGIN